MKPAQIRLAFDSGWSNGDPGDGRVRFDSPKIAKAASLCINARDAQETLLDQLVPAWGIGDVIVVERPSLDRNRVVAWIIGPIVHGGSYYRVPILVRSVNGNFAAHDELVLHHNKSMAEDLQDPDVNPHGPPETTPPRLDAPTQASAQPHELQIAPQPAQALIAGPSGANGANGANGMPETSQSSTPGDPGPMAPLAPMAPMAEAEMAQLRADNTVLHDIIAELLADTTELYVMEKTT